MRALAEAPLSVTRRRSGWHLWVFLVLLISGCLATTSRPTSFEEGRQSTPAPKTKSARAKEELVKKPRSSAGGHATTASEKHSAPGRKDAARKQKKGPDAELKKRLRNAAVKVARDLGSVRKMKLCHDQKTDEWWLTLYKELSTAVDVKQFFWSWEREEFAPFLVIRRISKSKLMDDLKKSEPGRRCSELPAPPPDSNDPFERFWGRSLDFETR